MATAVTRERARDETASVSVSVRDARKRFEMMSGSTNDIHRLPRQTTTQNKSVTSSDGLIETVQSKSAQGKTNPSEETNKIAANGTSTKTKNSSKTQRSSPILSNKSFSLSKKKKHSTNTSDLKRISRTDSDPAIAIQSKKSMFSKSKNGKKGSRSTDGLDSQTTPHSDQPKASPNHAGQGSSATDKKRREPPKPPSQSGSPEPKSPPQSPVKDSVGDVKQDVKRKQSKPITPSDDEATPRSPVKAASLSIGGDNGKGAKNKPPRPPSPQGVRDGDIKISVPEGTELSGDDLKKILKKQLAYLCGGLEEDKYPILIVPDVALKQLDSPGNQKEFNTTVLYLKTMISHEQCNNGVTVLLDARSSKTHTAVRWLLDIIASQQFPLSIHMVYIYMKTSLFSRSKNLASPDITAKLHLAYLTDQKSLVDHLEGSNIPTELGGTLQYNHRNWVHNRLEFEKMKRLFERAMTRFPFVKDALNLCSVPTSVKDAEVLMLEDLKLKEGLVNKLAEAELSIDRFLEVLKQQHDIGSLEISLGTKDYITMLSILNGMLEDVRSKQSEFDAFWGIHKARVDHMMRMCHFNRTAEKTKHLMQGHIDDLTGSEVILGDTLESSLELGEKHEAFVTKCKSTMDGHMDGIREDAHCLINPNFAPKESEKNMHSATKEAIENVKVRLADLTATYQELMTICQQKRDLFIVCVKFHMTNRQCQQWNEDALEFMATQPLEEPSGKMAITLTNQIDNLVYRLPESQVSTMLELAAALPVERQCNKKALKTSQKYEQVRELLKNRKAALMKIAAAAASTSAALPSNKSKSTRKRKNEIEIVNGNNTETSTSASSPALVNPEASLYLFKTRASGSTDYADGEEDSKVLKSRQNVFSELVETEKTYIKDMQTVLDAYYDSMDPDNMSIPLRLRGKRDIVFGNLQDIYKFHDSVFSKALDRYADHPERMGECFTQFNLEFQMYTAYCKNRSPSETLVNESTESQAFFKGIQRNLAHALDLNAYLLKPVQRITKYQLLLKDMMKHSVNAKKAYSDLQMALDRMLKALKNLNDSLHVVGLKGFPGALAEQGRLLVHDAFNVIDGASVSRSIFARGRERHVFLFEKVIIFSKKIDVPEEKKSKKSDAYLYKGHLDMADIALRPTIDTNPLQFTLTLHGSHKEIKFQASAKEIHAMWTLEIRRLLQVQFTLMKDKVIKSGTLDKRNYKGKTKLSTQTRGSRGMFAETFSTSEETDTQSVKKSISDRFRILKRKKGNGPDAKKPVKSTPSFEAQAAFLASGSLPPSLKYSISKSAGGRGIQGQAGLSKSNMETGKPYPEDSNSSDDDDITFSDDNYDDSTEGISVGHYESLAPSAPRHYIAITNYNPGDSEENGISLSEDQLVEVIGINQYGWWWVRVTNCYNGELEEGWVPASYLKVTDSLSSTKSTGTSLTLV